MGAGEGVVHVGEPLDRHLHRLDDRERRAGGIEQNAETGFARQIAPGRAIFRQQCAGGGLAAGKDQLEILVQGGDIVLGLNSTDEPCLRRFYVGGGKELVPEIRMRNVQIHDANPPWGSARLGLWCGAGAARPTRHRVGRMTREGQPG